MYQSVNYSLAASTTAGGATYVGFDNVYMGMAAFALFAAGSAFLRMAPVVRGRAARRRRELLDL